MRVLLVFKAAREAELLLIVFIVEAPHGLKRVENQQRI